MENFAVILGMAEPENYLEFLTDALESSKRSIWEQKMKAVKNNTEKGWFDFSENETVTVEKIIHSCLLNPERKKFPELSPYIRLYNH